VSNVTLRRALKIASLSVLIFLGVVIVCEVFSPYSTWYFVVPNARFTVDGRREKGWLHRGNHGATLFVTRRDRGKAESYMVSFPPQREGIVWSCGNWTAPRFPAFPIGDVNPPCWTFIASESRTPKPALPARNLKVGTDFVEFTADDGSRIKESW
jgi:hypothetical protein